MKKIAPFIETPKQDIRTSRKFRRSASHGMKVWRSMTINFDVVQVIEHVELECPNFELTPNGPMFKKQELEETE